MLAIAPDTIRSDDAAGLAPDSFKFDRRNSPRTRASGLAMGTFAKPDGQTALVRVELIDASRSGVGVRSPKPVAIGTVFSLFPDDAFAPSVRGIVARCIEDGDGFIIGLERTALRRVA